MTWLRTTTKVSLKGLPGKGHRISRRGPHTILQGPHTTLQDPRMNRRDHRMSPQDLLTHPDRHGDAMWDVREALVDSLAKPA